MRKQTLCAYASRGQIEVRSDPAHASRKLYWRTDISALLNKRNVGRARKTIAASTMAWGEPIVSTRIFTIVRGRLYYRGTDAVRLSANAHLEEVAQLLWDSAALPCVPVFEPVLTIGPARPRAYAAMGRAAAEEKPAHPLTVTDMWDEAAALVGRLASSFIDLHVGDEPLHLRFARAWSAEAHADLLRRTLVLLAGQELNGSAFAARVPASTGASLGACALTGLAALSGPLHGDANVRVQALLDEAKQSGTEIAVRRWMASGAPLPGFGRQLYPQGDPRAAALLAACQPPEHVCALIACADRLTGLKPNIDVALASLVEYGHLPDGAAFLLFAIGRSVGRIAHSIEQILSDGTPRPRANYVGPAISEVKDADR